jgi:xanthine dehydrogenase accessory factor
MLHHSQLTQLLAVYLHERSAQRPLVLATLIATQGSSYRKAGAQMLFTSDGTQTSLLSGGCLESDLREHAMQILADGLPRRVRYDLRNPDDDVFGMGSGCLGALDIFMQVINHENGWQPLAQLHDSWQQDRDARSGIVVQSHHPDLPVGSIITAAKDGIAANGVLLSQDSGIPPLFRSVAPNSLHTLAGDLHIFFLDTPAQPQILLLGGGMDARPLAKLINFMGWHCTVYDHRQTYADPVHFPDAERVVCSPSEQLSSTVSLAEFQAAIVMSHHLTADLNYLRQLAQTQIPYLGLLGPPQRRDRLLARLDDERSLLQPRLHAPVGLNIGAATPEGIALSIVAEVQQTLECRQETGAVINPAGQHHQA